MFVIDHVIGQRSVRILDGSEETPVGGADEKEADQDDADAHQEVQRTRNTRGLIASKLNSATLYTFYINVSVREPMSVLVLEPSARSRDGAHQAQSSDQSHVTHFL